ncbi:MAG: tetratricopeptide repeat protein [Pseudomonadota bacterium]
MKATPIVLLGLLIISFIYATEMTLISMDEPVKRIVVSATGNELPETLHSPSPAGGVSVDAELEEFETNEKVELTQNQKQSLKVGSVLFQRAVQASDQGNNIEAIGIYRELLDQKPNHQMAAINLGRLLRMEGQLIEALAVLENALKISGVSRLGKVFALLGITHYDLGHPEKAIPLFKKSIEYRPGHSLTWKRLAFAQSLAGYRYSEVMDSYGKSIALSPQFTSGLLAQARYQLSVLDADGVLNSFNRAQVTRGSDDWYDAAWFRLIIMAKLESGDLEAAAKLLRDHGNSISLFESNIDRALVYLIKKNFPAALELLVDDSPDVLYLRGLVHQTAGDMINALQNWRLLEDNAEYAYRARRQIALEQSRQDSLEAKLAALASFQSLVNSPIYYADVAYFAAKLAMDLGIIDMSYDLIDKAIHQAPKRRLFRLQRVRLDTANGNFDRAFADLDRLAEQFPRSRLVMRQQARTLIANGQFQEALRQYQQIPIKYTRQEDLLMMSDLYLRDKSPKLAYSVLTELIKRNNGHIEGRYQLARTLCMLDDMAECHRQAILVMKLDEKHTGAAGLLERMTHLNDSN